MPAHDDFFSDRPLDSNLVAIPISKEETQANIRVCALIRRVADPAAGHLVILEQFSGGQILLGCLCDAAGRITQWLELWLQDCSGAGATDSPSGENNAARDERWNRLAISLRRLDPESYLELSSAIHSPAPVFVDLETFTPFHPEIMGARIEVCQDSSRLAAAGLPIYGLDRDRYGWVPAEGEQGALVALHTSSGIESKVVPLSQFLPAAPARFVALNATGGRMLARHFAPLGLTEFAAVLGGRPWAGLVNARRPFKLGGIYQSLEDAAVVRCGGRHFFATREGQAGWAVEALHLKLLLIEQCVRLVRDETERSQLPMLNLSAESFRVRLGAIGSNLPFCWTARTVLSRFGEAAPLPVPNSRLRYFKTLEAPLGSIYRPEDLAIPKKGLCGFRLTKVLPLVEDGTVIEATLVTQQRIELNEMLEVSIPLLSGRITLYGTMNPSLARSQGEYLFRSVPLQFTPEQRAALEAVAGVAYSQVPFHVLPPLNTPCDLFALGVLALEILFAGSDITLPVALDACLTLARELAARVIPEQQLAETIRAVFKEDPRHAEYLGPRHLRQLGQEISPEYAEALIPPDLWFGLLAVVVRLFPGRGSFSYCRDFVDAPALAIHAVFDQPLLDLDLLCGHTRSLHAMDWAQNLELAEAIEGFLI